jgi:hypothetical protein
VTGMKSSWIPFLVLAALGVAEARAMTVEEA